MCLGIPGQIVAVTDTGRQMATADISGVRREVSLACVAPEGPLEDLIGAWALIHVGFAMALIDEAEAEATLAALHALGEAEEELAAMEQGRAALEGTP
jgi:hydrogenase expression/formation protein HypC